MKIKVISSLTKEVDTFMEYLKTSIEERLPGMKVRLAISNITSSKQY